jgi:tRNA1(Val) A37 N6-methylase TrmN6
LTTTPDDLTEGTLLGGRVRLLQPRQGYRVAIDPVLLAAAVPARTGESVLDAGLGSGAATLCLLARVPGCVACGIELQPPLADLARRNATLNGMAVDVVEGDLLDPPAALRGRQFAHVITNPPYAEAGVGPVSPDPQRGRAHAGADTAAWIDACLKRLEPGGRLTVIHRADRLGTLLAAIEGRAGDVAVLPLWPRAGEAARRVILGAHKGSRAPLRLLPGLVLHEADGRFTPAADAVLRDGAPLALEA